MRIVTCSQMKQAEQYAIENGVSALRLMENAGTAAARVIRETVRPDGAAALVICGRGNNGGDGFVVARKLHEAGFAACALLAAGDPHTPDAAEMLERLNGLPVTVVRGADADRLQHLLGRATLVVDALFGTGFRGRPSDEAAAVIGLINRAVQAKSMPVFSLDMPSGADADSGEVPGACIAADTTVAFGAAKTGQFTFPAAEYCGTVKAVNIGIPDAAFDDLLSPVELLEEHDVAAQLPRRSKDSNKGDYGRLLLLCGSSGMTGAAYMSAAAALRSGAGLVKLAVPSSVYPILASKLNEALVFPALETPEGSLALSNLDRFLALADASDALLIGCGLSRDPETVSLVRALVQHAACPVVLDADGINAFEGHIDLLRASKAELILTPHPGEMARLCGKSIRAVQASRLRTAAEFAGDAKLTLALKGAYTVVASKTGRVWINPTGNPGMARGGSGDILAGMVAAFAAQGFTPESAACCGVYLHGLAGDRCAQKLSQYGMLPTDLLTEIPQIFRGFSR